VKAVAGGFLRHRVNYVTKGGSRTTTTTTANATVSPSPPPNDFIAFAPSDAHDHVAAEDDMHITTFQCEL